MTLGKQSVSIQMLFTARLYHKRFRRYFMFCKTDLQALACYVRFSIDANARFSIAATAQLSIWPRTT